MTHDEGHKGRWLVPGICVASILAVMVVALRYQGRTWWCACGRWFFWTASAWSEHTSQHLFDPYTFTHLLHGFVFWWLLAWWSNRHRDPGLFAIAVGAEAAWEILENSQFIIDRYRAATAAIGYSGDTVLNSLFDVASCALGFGIARWLGWRKAVPVFVATELILAFWVRDNLVLNVLMLVWPTQAWPMPLFKQWQLGG